MCSACGGSGNCNDLNWNRTLSSGSSFTRRCSLGIACSWINGSNSSAVYPSIKYTCKTCGKPWLSETYVCNSCAKERVSPIAHDCWECGGTGYSKPCTHKLYQHHFFCEHNSNGQKHR